MKPIQSSPLKGFLSVAAIRFFAWLPNSISQIIAKIIVRLLLIFNTKLVKVSRFNIKQAFPNQSVPEQESLIKKSLLNTVETSIEICKLWIQPPEQYRSKIQLEVENEQQFKDLYQSEQGVIIALPHIGNWEVLNHYLMNQFDFTALYRAPRIQQLDHIIRGARERTGGKLVAAGKKGVIHLFKSLKKGDLTVILPDQEPGKSGGIFAPFYNKSAWTMTLLSKLTQKTGAKVIFAVVERIEFNQSYKIHFFLPDESIYSDDTLVAASALNHGVEKAIAISPEQFQWSYRRYKKRPEGEKRFY